MNPLHKENIAPLNKDGIVPKSSVVEISSLEKKKNRKSLVSRSKVIVMHTIDVYTFN